MAVALWIISTGVLGVTIFLQYGLDLAPCPLCILQRLPWILIWLFATMKLLYPRPLGIFRAFRPSASVLLLCGMGLAFYHIGIQHGWWEAHCDFLSPEALSVSSLKQQLLQQNGIVTCNAVTFRLWGLSLPENNLLISVLTFLILWLWPRKKRL